MTRDARDPAAIGREVLEREGAALQAAARTLGDAFTRAVELLETARGRVIVTGVGKSGLVGAKIAATLTSTGTTAFFLHPTEALHGDLGIVGRGDVMLALSKSGRSAELMHLLPHVRRIGASVVAMVETAVSPLGEEADVVLEMGRVEEACSLDLVPTTSTTLMLALGDALAVALLRRRGLSADDFAFVHPGGLIGRQIARRVEDLMHGGDALPEAPVTATLREALVEIMEKGLGITTLRREDGTLAGVLTDGDLKRILLQADGERLLSRSVRDFMSTSPRTIAPRALVASAVRLMEERRPGAVTSLVVVDHDVPVGIIHLHDCLRVEAAPRLPSEE